MSDAYTQIVSGCLEEAIGGNGLSRSQLDAKVARLAPALADLKADYAEGRIALLRISEASEDVAEAEAAFNALAEGAETVVFFGTGGSALGGQTLAQLGGWNIPGVASPSQRMRPRTRFYDNLDPLTLASALASLDLARTRFVVTSKSGGTPETLVQALAALQAVKDKGLGDRIPKLFLGITEPAVPAKGNGLRTLFEQHGIPLLAHHTGIGGRFSVLTNVGLMPAIARGLDARAVRRGAQSVVQAMLAAKDPAQLAPAVGAALAVALCDHKGIRASVMMPYSDRLGKFSHWYAQLWAESLGKAGRGTAPIACVGPLDQHSQLQLFMDGPRDYVINVVRTPMAGTGPKLSKALADSAGLGYLGGRTTGDLVEAQSVALPQALIKAGRPVRIFEVPTLDEHALGALMMHLMLETILAARLWGIDPFDQPAVELAKVITRERVAAMPQ
ncbi:MAG: glucose-6-phosphate isomerase [Hyphomicrobiaceae bacterium]|nr:glucose-6-phosphate isomerase [Hyphomicrobiaceae bacterium]